MAVVTYKCPNCGGDVRFDPDTQKYKCEFCISSFTEEEVQQVGQSETVQKEEQTVAKEDGTEETSTTEAVVYNCPSCGAEIVTDATTAATFCYYCHNPIILGGKLAGEYLPDKVVPFEVSQKEAVDIFLEWVHSKRFVPKNFFTKKQIEKISGIYFPYWIMDCDVDVDASGTGTKTRTWIKQDEEYTETSFYEVEREGTIHFEDLCQNALKNADKQLVEAVMPFDTKKMKDFSMGYLSGFQAQKRDLEQTDLQAAMDKDVDTYSREVLDNNLVAYKTMKFDKMELNTRNASWEYVLLPVWVLTYKGVGRTYYYALNGQTKEMCGVLPVDKGRLALFCASFSIALSALLTLGGLLIW